MKKKRIMIGSLLILTLVLLVGCGSDSDWDSSTDEASTMHFAPESAEVSLAEDADDWEWEAGEAELTRDESPSFEMDLEEEERAFSAIPILLPSESGRQLSYDVDFLGETIDFIPSIQLLWETIGELGGYVEHERIFGRSLLHPDQWRSANFELRIPNEELGTFIHFLASTFAIEDYRRDLEDFTFAYERHQANLEFLREQEARISEELATDDDGVEVEVTPADLNDVQSQIRDLEERVTLIERDVNYSQITMRIREVIFEEPEPEEMPPTFGEQLQETLGRAGDILLVTIQILILFLAAVLPWAILISAIVIPIVYVAKKRKSKNGKNNILGG